MAIPVLAGVVMKIAVPLIVQKLAGKMPKREADDIAAQTVQAIVEEVAANPVVKNQMNMEPAYQSRVAWGSIIAALGVLIPIAANWFGYNIGADRVVEIGSAVMTLGGAGYALYGRFKTGLKPLFAG